MLKLEARKKKRYGDGSFWNWGNKDQTELLLRIYDKKKFKINSIKITFKLSNICQAFSQVLGAEYTVKDKTGGIENTELPNFIFYIFCNRDNGF